MRSLRLAALAALALAASACELATHALDYGVDTAALHPLCTPCEAAATALRTPPCRVGSDAPDGLFPTVFAVRRVSFGHAGAFADARAFDRGRDLDCSMRRSRGVPVLCAPRERTGWDPLPDGVDDALLQRVLAPAYVDEKPPGSFDLDGALSAAFASGRYGLIITVDHWDGRPDDPDVEVTLRSSPGLAGGSAPAWDGADAWASYPDIDAAGDRPFHLDRLPGYVAGGTLVVDARAIGPMMFHFGPRGFGFNLVLDDLAFSGALTAEGLDRFTMSGVVDLPTAHDAVVSIASASGVCDTSAGAFFTDAAPRVDKAADMPLDPGATPDRPCDAISFAWSLDARPAHLGPVVDDSGPRVGDRPPCGD